MGGGGGYGWLGRMKHLKCTIFQREDCEGAGFGNLEVGRRDVDVI